MEAKIKLMRALTTNLWYCEHGETKMSIYDQYTVLFKGSICYVARTRNIIKAMLKKLFEEKQSIKPSDSILDYHKLTDRMITKNNDKCKVCKMHEIHKAHVGIQIAFATMVAYRRIINVKWKCADMNVYKNITNEMEVKKQIAAMCVVAHFETAMERLNAIKKAIQLQMEQRNELEVIIQFNTALIEFDKTALELYAETELTTYDVDGETNVNQAINRCINNMGSARNKIVIRSVEKGMEMKVEVLYRENENHATEWDGQKTQQTTIEVQIPRPTNSSGIIQRILQAGGISMWRKLMAIQAIFASLANASTVNWVNAMQCEVYGERKVVIEPRATIPNSLGQTEIRSDIKIPIIVDIKNNTTLIQLAKNDQTKRTLVTAGCILRQNNEGSGMSARLIYVEPGELYGKIDCNKEVATMNSANSKTGKVASQMLWEEPNYIIEPVANHIEEALKYRDETHLPINTCQNNVLELQLVVIHNEGLPNTYHITLEPAVEAKTILIDFILVCGKVNSTTMQASMMAKILENRHDKTTSLIANIQKLGRIDNTCVQKMLWWMLMKAEQITQLDNIEWHKGSAQKTLHKTEETNMCYVPDVFGRTLKHIIDYPITIATPEIGGKRQKKEMHETTDSLTNSIWCGSLQYRSQAVNCSMYLEWNANREEDPKTDIMQAHALAPITLKVTDNWPINVNNNKSVEQKHIKIGHAKHTNIAKTLNSEEKMIIMGAHYDGD